MDFLKFRGLAIIALKATEPSNVYTAQISSSVSVLQFLTFKAKGCCFQLVPQQTKLSAFASGKPVGDHVLVTSLVTPTGWPGYPCTCIMPSRCSSLVGETSRWGLIVYWRKHMAVSKTKEGLCSNQECIAGEVLIADWEEKKK